MLLEQIVEHPDSSLLYMERYLNDGSPSGFTYKNQTSYNTSPSGKNKYFYLDIVCCENNLIERIGKTPCFIQGIPIFIHPDMSALLSKKGILTKKSSIKVAPTSSSRTVKLLDYPGYIKLNYDGIIGRINRKLTDRHVYASIDMTSLLEKALMHSRYAKLLFYKESYGIIYRNSEKEINMGMVYREEKPSGINAQTTNCIIPMFSLFAKDESALDKQLIIQLIEKSKKDPIEYVVNDLIFNIIDNYFNLLLNEGIQPEWHAQNLLIGIDKNFSISSIIMRDLESIDIDQTLQQSLGINHKFKSYPYKHLNNDQYNYQIKHSFMYDFKIGEYIFKPLINCISKHFNLDVAYIEKEIKIYAENYIRKLPADFFPENGVWYSFDKVIVDRSTTYRPYIKNYNVKYRG